MNPVSKEDIVYKTIYESLPMMPKDLVDIIYKDKTEAEKYEEDLKQRLDLKLVEVICDSMHDMAREIVKREHIQLTPYLCQTHIWENKLDTFIPLELIKNPVVYKFMHSGIKSSYIGSYSNGLEMLNKCNCCDVHQRRKPEKITEFEKVCEYRSEQNFHNVSLCKCLCRHHARNLVMLYHFNCGGRGFEN
jgi:hypothetical protein